MKNTLRSAALVLLVGLALASASRAADPAPATVPVTVENFIRAETDLYFAQVLKETHGVLGRFTHHREPAAIAHQTVIRMNRDTLYSAALFDLAAGPVKITLPDAGARFRSMEVINQDHYVSAVIYKPGVHALTQTKVGTRYAFVAVRTLVDPSRSDDLAQVHALQDAIQVSQPGGPGKFEIPAWDPVSQKKVRDALLVLAATLPDFKAAFGTKKQVDPVRHLIGSASAWGGNPDKDATYLNITPAQNDGKTAYTLVVKDVPVDAFWSISVYNAKGYFEPNAENAYSINSITAKKGADGAVTIRFGGDAGSENHLPIVSGWNYTVRLYRPHKEILNGTWRFPEPQPVK